MYYISISNTFPSHCVTRGTDTTVYADNKPRVQNDPHDYLHAGTLNEQLGLHWEYYAAVQCPLFNIVLAVTMVSYIWHGCLCVSLTSDSLRVLFFQDSGICTAWWVLLHLWILSEFCTSDKSHCLLYVGHKATTEKLNLPELFLQTVPPLNKQHLLQCYRPCLKLVF